MIINIFDDDARSTFHISNIYPAFPESLEGLLFSPKVAWKREPGYFGLFAEPVTVKKSS